MFKFLPSRIGLCLFAGLLIAQAPCSADSYLSEENRPNKTQEATPSAQLIGTAWQLALINIETKSVRPEQPAHYTLQFDGQGKVTVQADCNRGSGLWQSAAPGQLQLGPLALTEALCPSGSLHDSFLEHLEAVTRFTLNEGNLILADHSGDLMIFNPMKAGQSVMQVPKSQEEGEPSSWQITETNRKVNLYQKPSVFAPILEVLEPDLRLSNLGCQLAEDEVWCDVQLLGGGVRGFVQSKFLKPAQSSDGVAVNGLDNSALRAGQGDFDATGQVPCAQYTGQPMEQCEFGVARSGGGYATLVITTPNSRQRIIYFKDGTAIGSGTSEASEVEKSSSFSAYKEAELYFIKVGDERYEVPEAVIFGD